MWRAQAASSPCVIGVPRLRTAASAGPASNISSTLRVNMADSSRCIDAPARDAVVVLARETRNPWHARSLAAHRDDLRARRLHVALIVPGAALQDCRAAIPLPRDAKARERLCHHGLLQCGLPPCRPPAGERPHLADATVPGAV